jgi:hypothetical protein
MVGGEVVYVAATVRAARIPHTHKRGWEGDVWTGRVEGRAAAEERRGGIGGSNQKGNAGPHTHTQRTRT